MTLPPEKPTEALTDAQQKRIDHVVYYRNLAISCGAKPNQMLNDFDRRLAATYPWPWEKGDGPSTTQQIAEVEDIWKKADALEERATQAELKAARKHLEAAIATDRLYIEATEDQLRAATQENERLREGIRHAEVSALALSEGLQTWAAGHFDIDLGRTLGRGILYGLACQAARLAEQHVRAALASPAPESESK